GHEPVEHLAVAQIARAHLAAHRLLDALGHDVARDHAIAGRLGERHDVVADRAGRAGHEDGAFRTRARCARAHDKSSASLRPGSAARISPLPIKTASARPSATRSSSSRLDTPLMYTATRSRGIFWIARP